jgi:carbamoyltransferase
MLILGVHGGYLRDDEDDQIGYALHDSAAVVLRDGELVAAVEEERLSRVKHTNCFPQQAIGRCLDLAGATLDQVDRIALNITEPALLGMERTLLMSNPSLPLRMEGTRLERRFEEMGTAVAGRLRFCHHHLAHAWSAFGPSGFADSLVMSVDGDGDNASGMILAGRGRSLQVLRELTLRQSLGNLYVSLIRVLGYSRFEEYKVMGLAPHGDESVYRAVFERCYRLMPDGHYSIFDGQAWFSELAAAGLIEASRQKGEPFTQVHKDFAAGLQGMLERIVFHVLEHYQRTTGLTRLCLAGGVAHNCTLNGKILRSGLFEQVFVQPAAHDAGGALGAAWWVAASECPSASKPKLTHVSLGTPVANTEAVRRELSRWEDLVSFELLADPAQTAAQALADGAVIGWVQGRAEFGPRALGHRSILADPRPATNRTRINMMVKKREVYRPFAPSVLEERVTEFFDVPANQRDFPFMVFVMPVRVDKREVLGAVTHVDGTARVQTVSHATNPLYWELIDHFGRLTGVPVVLNTSFNNNAEPIVDSVVDALTCFLTTGLDLLIVDRFLVRRRSQSTADSLDSLSFRLSPSRKLVLQQGVGGADAHCRLEATKSRELQKQHLPVSRAVFDVLCLAGRHPTLRQTMEALALSPTEQAAVRLELLELWSERAVSMQPAANDEAMFGPQTELIEEVAS